MKTILYEIRKIFSPVILIIFFAAILAEPCYLTIRYLANDTYFARPEDYSADSYLARMTADAQTYNETAITKKVLTAESGLDKIEASGKNSDIYEARRWRLYKDMYAKTLISQEEIRSLTSNRGYRYIYESFAEDWFPCIIIILFIAGMASNEYSTGMIFLLSTSAGYRRKLWLSKLGAVSLLSIVYGILSNIGKIAVYTFLYKIPIGNQPIQIAFEAFADSPYDFTVKQLFIRVLLIRIFCLLAIALLTLTISYLARNTIAAAAITGILTGAPLLVFHNTFFSYSAYQTAAGYFPSNIYAGFWLYKNFETVDFFGFPVTKPVFLSFLLSFFIIAAAGVCYLIHAKSRVVRKRLFTFQFRNASVRSRKRYGILCFEIKKFIREPMRVAVWTTGSIIVVCALLLPAVFRIDKEYEYYYGKYVSQYAGQADSDKIRSISEDLQRTEALIRQKEKIDRGELRLEEAEYQSFTEQWSEYYPMHPAIRNTMEKITEYGKHSAEDRLYFFQDTGWTVFLKYAFVPLLASMLLISLLGAAFVNDEVNNGTDIYIRTAARRRRETLWIKYGILAAASLLTAMLLLVIWNLLVHSSYGLYGSSLPLNGIASFLSSAYSGSLTSFLILIYTATALLSLLFAGLVILYSNKFKSVIFTAFLGMITALAIFAGIDTVFKI
ncbi:MAG: hypothetical protein ACLSVG_02530 [Clostridia bacterium]